METKTPVPAAPLEASLSYRVPYADTDQMGFVYYGNYLTYFERSRNELMRKTPLTYAAMEALGLGLPVLEAHVEYKSAAHYDDELTLVGRLAEAHHFKVRVECEVRRGEEVLAKGYTIHACMDLKTHRPTRLPPGFPVVQRT